MSEHVIENTKRLDHIDAAKAIAILMIMLGHITELANPVDMWMSSCKICVFYVIYGFLMAYTSGLHKRTPRRFVGNILSTIAWPYLTFSVIAIFVKCFYTFSKHEGMEAVTETFIKNFDKTVFLKGINSMWFLPTIFFGALIVLLLYMAPKWVRIIFAAVGLFGLKAAVAVDGIIEGLGLSERLAGDMIYLSNMMGKSIVAAWFVGSGYVVYLIMNKYDLLEGHMLGKLVAGSIFTVSNVFLALRNPGVDFNRMTMGEHPWMFIYGGIVGSMGMILLLDVISSHIDLSPLTYWGKNSLILMCTHTALGFKKIAFEGWSAAAYMPDHVCLEYIIECLLVLAVLMLIMYAVIEMINRFFPALTKFPAKSGAHSRSITYYKIPEHGGVEPLLTGAVIQKRLDEAESYF